MSSIILNNHSTLVVCRYLHVKLYLDINKNIGSRKMSGNLLLFLFFMNLSYLPILHGTVITTQNQRNLTYILGLAAS